MTDLFSATEIEALRGDTAGCSSDVIFFNNAGASLPPRPVVERAIEHLRLEEAIGGYEAADRVDAERNAVYHSVAALVGADAQEIAITESATRAWDMAFYSLAFRPGDRILTAQNEYSSNYIAFLQMAERSGAKIVCVPAEPSGEVSLQSMEELLRDGNVKLVALTHIATNNGMVQPAAEVGKLTRAHGVTFLLDACQSVGQMQLDVEELGCDLLSATGRKFLRGPRGTGFLYVRRGLIEQLKPPFLDNHAAEWTSDDAYTMRGDARRFEAWESSVALALGLKTAADYAVKIGLGRIESRVQALAASLRSKLARIEGVTVTDAGTLKSGIVMFVHDTVRTVDLVARLAAKQCIVRMIPRFGTRLDTRLSAMDDLVRASVHYFNTDDEVDRFCEILATVVGSR